MAGWWWKFDGLRIHADTAAMTQQVLGWIFGIIYGTFVFLIPFALLWYFILYEGVPERWRIPAVLGRLRAWLRGTGGFRP